MREHVPYHCNKIIIKTVVQASSSCAKYVCCVSARLKCDGPLSYAEELIVRHTQPPAAGCLGQPLRPLLQQQSLHPVVAGTHPAQSTTANKRAMQHNKTIEPSKHRHGNESQEVRRNHCFDDSGRYRTHLVDRKLRSHKYTYVLSLIVKCKVKIQ